MTVAASTLDRSTVEELLHREARLLDEQRYDEWLELLTDDIVYWVPSWHGDTEVVSDPSREVSLLYLDRSGLEDYIARAVSGDAHVMEPGPRIDRFVSNVMVVDPTEGVVRSKWLMHSYRRGRQEFFAGDGEHRLRRERGELRIAAKKIVLTNNALAQGFLPLI